MTEPIGGLEPLESGLTRRHVVRTAGTAAWAAPVIVAASAAPAYAGSPGAAIVRAGTPSTLRLDDAITIISVFDNVGTAPAASMTVTVTLTPVAGTLVDADPTEVASGFSFVSKSTSPSGAQVLNFSKNDPQVTPGDPSSLDRRLQFKISHTPQAVTGAQAADIEIVPSVPPPSTASPATGSYPRIL